MTHVPLFLAVSFKGSDYNSVSCNDKRGADINHKQGDLQIYFCVIFLETRHHAQAHITSGAFIHSALSLAARGTHAAAEAGLTISFASVYFDDTRAAKRLLQPYLVFQPIWGSGDLGCFQLSRSNSSPEGA